MVVATFMMEETLNFSQRLVKDVVFLLSKSSEPLNSLKGGLGLGEPPTHSHGQGRAPSEGHRGRDSC